MSFKKKRGFIFNYDLNLVFNNYRQQGKQGRFLLALKQENPPPEEDIAIIIDTINRTLTLIRDGQPDQQFQVAVGKPQTPSPVGTWEVIQKSTNWGTGFGARWLGLNVRWGIYGIHGTNKPASIGSYASHGCIRMHNEKVKQLYPLVSLNTPVYIIGNRSFLHVHS